MAKAPAMVKSWFDRVEDFLDELLAAGPAYRKLQGALRFLILVWRGSVVNRCPVRAAALSYTTLLALVPLLAVVLSVSKTFLRDTSANVVPDLMNKAIALIAPDLGTVSPDAQRETVEKIQSFIDNIHAGALGTVGTVFLIFVAVRLLMAVEQTLNDIWGVPVGRSIWRKIVYYWTTVTLGPLLLVLAVYLTGRAEVLAVMGRLSVIPGIQKALLQLAPFVVLWVAFSLMYALMPNTHVRPTAAIAGGIFAGTLWQVNSWLSTLYVSRVITYTKIYGALGIIPVLLVGLYFSWLIVLLGAQVAYATQHIRIYRQRRAGERIDQRGRELVACRVVLVACQHFLRGTQPPTVDELVEQIGAPANWLTQLVYRLAEGGVLARVDGAGDGIVPARSPDTMTVADVLEVLRTSPVAHHGNSRAGDETMRVLLAELDSALRSSPSNHRFSELVGRLK
jgi:membrane protein